ncbi:hypothetical protein AK812_SmicGene30677 [Symbiodinium microadriaticum]|uniref:Uncharacterized protein n=1 Tax=Symbiodinium microadriaticum TaxID=2951 RepID=A0A1Q9CYT4_SYMMI|nr:hypothetical protein AK812_SmicGene30677 [Symbiodinium microadriaticum]
MLGVCHSKLTSCTAGSPTAKGVERELEQRAGEGLLCRDGDDDTKAIANDLDLPRIGYGDWEIRGTPRGQGGETRLERALVTGGGSLRLQSWTPRGGFHIGLGRSYGATAVGDGAVDANGCSKVGVENPDSATKYRWSLGTLWQRRSGEKVPQPASNAVCRGRNGYGFAHWSD